MVGAFGRVLILKVVIQRQEINVMHNHEVTLVSTQKETDVE